ncbi:transcription factor Adf-1 [Halyomorpha halys]|uniref:transcription factor Adf-1 n=1 Tax=Halyomorpha halys TaxID=286706 RepID=UPI0034D1D017
MNEQTFNIKLVGEVEKRPVLYNFTLPGYSRKDETEKAWNEVGEAVNMTAAECKERWKNLRAVFVRNMKSTKCAPGTKTKKAYYLLEAMQFTVPYIKALSTPTANLPNPREQQEDESSEEIRFNSSEWLGLSSPVEQSPSRTSTPSPNSQSYTASTSGMSQKMKCTTQNQSESSPSFVCYKKRNYVIEGVDNTFLEDFRAKKAKMVSCADHANQEQKSEGLKMFLLSMLPDVLKMTDEEVRMSFLQLRKFLIFTVTVLQLVELKILKMIL